MKGLWTISLIVFYLFLLFLGNVRLLTVSSQDSFLFLLFGALKYDMVSFYSSV